MHGNRMLTVTALVAFAASQALIGCNPAPAPSPAPQSAVQPAGGTGGGKSVVLLDPLDAQGTNWSAGHKVESNDVVTWKAKIAFYIEFDPANNPCGPDVNGGSANRYNSKQQGNHYEAQ